MLSHLSPSESGPEGVRGQASTWSLKRIPNLDIPTALASAMRLGLRTQRFGFKDGRVLRFWVWGLVVKAVEC